MAGVHRKAAVASPFLVASKSLCISADHVKVCSGQLHAKSSLGMKL